MSLPAGMSIPMGSGGKRPFPRNLPGSDSALWGFTGNPLPAQLPLYLETPSLYFHQRENFIKLPKPGCAASRGILPTGALMWDYPNGSEVEAGINSSQFLLWLLMFGLRRRSFKSFIISWVGIKQEYFSWEA